MAQKTKGATAPPAGTMQQRLEVSALRGEIGLLKSILDSDRASITASRMQEDKDFEVNRMGILLQDAYYLKLLLCDQSKKTVKQLEGIDIYEKRTIPEALSRKMKAVSEVKFAEGKKLLTLMKDKIADGEKEVAKLAKAFRKISAPGNTDIQELASPAYELALLKSFASNPHVGKQMIKGFYQEISLLFEEPWNPGPGIDLIDDIVQWKITGAPTEQAANLLQGYSNVESGFICVETAVQQISDGLDAISASERKHIESLSNSASAEMMGRMGLHRDFSEDPCERKTAHIPATEKLIRRKEGRLRGIIEAIARQTEETQVKEFAGIPKKRLRRIAACWEELGEHELAPRRLTRIYAELGDWANAKKWIEEDLARNLDYERETQSLKFGLEIAEASKDEEWKKHLNGRLAAHLSVPPFTSQHAEMRSRLRARGEDRGNEGYA